MTDTQVAPDATVPVLTCDWRHMLKVVRALESGTYQQGHGFLRREPTFGFAPGEVTRYEDCCAGVACQVRVLEGGGGRWVREGSESIPQPLTFTDVLEGPVSVDDDGPFHDKVTSNTLLTVGTVGWLGLVMGEAPPTGWPEESGDPVTAVPVFLPEAFRNCASDCDDGHDCLADALERGWHTAVDLNDAGAPFSVIARALRFTYLRRDERRLAARQAELQRLGKNRLAALYRQGGYIASAHPPERWLKGELITGILDFEMPDYWQGGEYATEAVLES